MATLAFNKILGLVLAWKSGRKVSLLPLGPSCPLQIILLSDMVGWDSPLRIVMAVTPAQEVQIQKKVWQSVITLSAEGCHA